MNFTELHQLDNPQQCQKGTFTFSQGQNCLIIHACLQHAWPFRSSKLICLTTQGSKGTLISANLGTYLTRLPFCTRLPCDQIDTSFVSRVHRRYAGSITAKLHLDPWSQSSEDRSTYPHILCVEFLQGDTSKLQCGKSWWFLDVFFQMFIMFKTKKRNVEIPLRNQHRSC